LKKLLAVLLMAALVLAACGSPAPAPAPAAPATDAPAADAADAAPDAADGIRIALVTDYGTIDDGSFNQGSWEGVVAFAGPRGIGHEYFQPAEVSDAAYIDAIGLAISVGAEIVVTPGFLFGAAVYEAQELWPEVNFVLIDSQPNMDGNTHIADNTVAVLYA